MKIAYLLCASTALALPAMASAQSSGTVDFEEEEIIVIGTVDRDGVEGIVIPDTTKAKAVLTDEIIQRQTPGQTILDTINLIPGVSFQNNDPYGSAGGNLTIRGFSSDRVSLTFDGVPLNDSGNYAIYSNQQLDPELIEQVNVNLGTTDVDSPTASAVGGTVNYRTRLPYEDLGAVASASFGDFNFSRVFGAFDTGVLTAFGTRAFVAASTARNNSPYNGYGKIDKQQYNGRVYQPLGSNGDFLSLSGHYNENRNNFSGSVALRNDRETPNGFPERPSEREYEIESCTIDTPQPGVADTTNSCGTQFDRRYNPSNTGNVRGASRFTLTDKLTLAVDPSFQYVKANGGGTVIGNETARTVGGRPFFGYIGGRPYAGVDLNGDGDLLDQVTVLAPSQTKTRRVGVISSLAYEIDQSNRIRVAYTYDRARHRQTGQVGFLQINGEPEDVFPINDPIIDANGNVLQKRDRLSFAILHQISGEYRGTFVDDRLVVQLGLRAPFFERDLNQYCFTTSAGGFVDCFGQDQALNDAYEAVSPNAATPQSRNFTYNKLLPNIGFTFDIAPRTNIFGNYAKGLSVPSTDNLYNSIFFPEGTEAAQPRPETTDSFDLGVRYTSRMVQAQLAGWYTKFSERTASSFDPELNETVFRNLGEVDKMGIDASLAYQPIPEIVLYAFGSYLDSKINDDIQLGVVGGQPVFADTSGNQESGAPRYTFGGRAQAMLGPLELGAQFKRTGKRFVYDTNEPVRAVSGGETIELFPAAAPAYTLVDLDARLPLARYGLERTYFQLNVTNLFDEVYVGGFGGGLAQQRANGSFSSPPFVQIGAPRTLSGTITVGF